MTHFFALLATPLKIFMAQPLLALAPALLFVLPAVLFRFYFRQPGSKAATIACSMAAIAWIGYGLYERQMLDWSKTVVAPIRADLLMIAPALWILTMVGMWGCAELVLRVTSDRSHHRE